MANYDAGLASSYVLRMNAWEASTNASANQSSVSWYLEIIKGTGSGKYAGGPHYWSVNIGGNTYSGSFSSYDFRNYSLLTLASGSTTINHSADGTGSAYIGGSFDDGNTYGVLGDATAQGTLGLSTLKVVPGTPSGVTAARVSDTSVNVSWAQSSASNGQPVSSQIYRSVNGSSYDKVLDIGATTSASVTSAANQKLSYKVSSWNSAGFGGTSAASAAVYTTPGAPTNATAVKNSSLNIDIAFTPNVAYTEHTHQVWHGTVSGGVTTWDGSALATLASGTTGYTHTAPNSGQVHVYRVRSASGSLYSGYSTTQSVQLLVAPNKPDVPSMAAYADKAVALDFYWVHNPIDTTPQKAYEFSYSLNGGASYTTTGKITSTVTFRTLDANTIPAGLTFTSRVRTWGSATTGGSEGTGASPWSDLRAVTFKTAPAATITTPSSGSTLNDATVRVTVGFSQAEGASFVGTQIELKQGATLLETMDSALQVGITLSTQVQNGSSYTVRARVQDSNGIWSSWATSTFNVVYLSPVPAVATASYLPDTGYGQLNVSIASPAGGQSAATTLTITRKIDGITEVIVSSYPVSSALTFLDTTPTIHGTNTYTFTTTSALGAQSVTTVIMVTEECRRAYLSKGAGFSNVVVFGGNLSVSESLSVASATVEAAGRTKPIGLYGIETSVQLKVKSLIFEGFGSSVSQVRAILLVPGKACYRDSSGRRVFGSVSGSLSYDKAARGDLSFTLTETS